MKLKNVEDYMKKIFLIITFIITNLFCLFAGGGTQFDGMIVLTANGEKGIAADDTSLTFFVLVYGECEIYYNNKPCPLKLWQLPVGIKVMFKGGITGGWPMENGFKIYRPDTFMACKVSIKMKIMTVDRGDHKSYTAATLVNDLLNNLYPQLDYTMKADFKTRILALMNIDASVQLNQGEQVVIPAIEDGFLARNYCIGSEIVFPSVYKIVRIISDQDAAGKSTAGERVYNKLVVIDYNRGFSVIASKELPKDNITLQYTIPLHYDGPASKFVVVAAAKHFFIFDVRVNKLSEKIVPRFKNAEYADAQSGNLSFTGISADGKTLSGEALDFGSFEYDLTVPSAPLQK
jgi:hypothetical protein